MKNPLGCLGILSCCLILGWSGIVQGADKPNQSSTQNSKATCLSCHGPFEKFINQTLKYQTDGQTINPHKTVPHDSKKIEDFPDCVTCHKPHPLPPPTGYKDKKVDLTVCYDCHHNYQFQPCSNCHK